MKSVGGINSGPLDVQKEVSTGALGLNIWPQKLREKVKILKIWLLGVSECDGLATSAGACRLNCCGVVVG